MVCLVLAGAVGCSRAEPMLEELIEEGNYAHQNMFETAPELGS